MEVDLLLSFLSAGSGPIELWQRDPLAARWIEVQEHARALPFELFGLAAEIECRADRKATGGPTFLART